MEGLDVCPRIRGQRHRHMRLDLQAERFMVEQRILRPDQTRLDHPLDPARE